jgi:hypothetical protein
VNQYGDAGVARDVACLLPLRFGVDQDVLAVGIDPRQQRLRLPVRHQGDEGG